MSDVAGGGDAIRDEWGSLSAAFIETVQAALNARDPKAVRAATQDLHAADLADLIEALEPEDRVGLITALGKGFDVEALAELDEGVRDQLMEALPNAVIASAIEKLDTDDAAYVIEDLDPEDKEEILAQLPNAERVALDRALEYPEGTAGRLMQTEFVAVPEFWSVGRTIDYLRAEKGLPEDFIDIYVVDPLMHLKGIVPASRVLRHPREKKMAEILRDADAVFRVSDETDDISFKFKQYNLVAAPVTDENGRLVGMLTVDDVVDVIEEEAEEDILHLGGVGAEETISDTVWKTTRSRFTWLLLNCGTAVLASWVISRFDATINQMVALAVLMPIVSSLGGNAGTQTMTVAVRALATRNLGSLNAFKVILRECTVGLINGLIFACIIGLFSFWWFGSDKLGFVIASAMVINLIAAALAGILMPLTLDYFDIDPAVASGVFVTMVTDVVGFFAFLGLATLWIHP